MLRPGSTFAAYEVLRRLAVGGMGEVYLCRHRLLDRVDAVKVLRPHLAQQPDFRRRFLREALSAARLRHPGVVTVYTADEADGLLYLAMEHVPGIDLASILDSGPLDPARTVRLLAAVADALDAAHAVNLVHRDVKPSNLLVTAPATAAESVTLVDFGISRRFDADTDITRTGEIVGTIAYCAPEQLSGSPVDGSCDQYALAGVAFECLTGSVPYPRETQLAMVTAHLTCPPPAATDLRPDLPSAVDAVLARGLGKAPAARYPSCAAFVAALADALGSVPHFRDACGAESSEQFRDACGAEPSGQFPDPDELLVRVAGGDLRQTPLAVRVGSAGLTPLIVPLDAGVTVLRAGDDVAAAMATWVICQAVVRRPARDLCLAAALAPAPEQSWLWLNWLPHARPGTPPVSGTHVATTPEAAADLLARLRAVSRQRAELGTAGPPVLALLDTRLGARPDDPAVGGSGVTVLYLARPGVPAPAGASTVDVSGGRCRVVVAGRSTVGVPDLVPSGYGREVADLLPDS